MGEKKKKELKAVKPDLFLWRSSSSWSVPRTSSPPAATTVSMTRAIDREIVDPSSYHTVEPQSDFPVYPAYVRVPGHSERRLYHCLPAGHWRYVRHPERHQGHRDRNGQRGFGP